MTSIIGLATQSALQISCLSFPLLPNPQRTLCASGLFSRAPVPGVSGISGIPGVSSIARGRGRCEARGSTRAIALPEQKIQILDGVDDDGEGKQ